MSQSIKQSHLMREHLALVVATYEYLEHGLARTIEELDRARGAAHERTADEHDRRAVLGFDVAADGTVTVDVKVSS